MTRTGILSKWGRLFNRANTITGIRIVCSIALLFCPVFSPVFYALYITAGVSDMVDGTVARKTNTVSEFGSKLDTVADFSLVAACLIKLIPVLDIPVWLYIWIGVIALIKAINIVSGYVMTKRLVAAHTVLNKIAGVLLFVLPLTLQKIDLKYSGAVACAAATIAAIHEGYIIMARRDKQPNTLLSGEETMIKRAKPEDAGVLAALAIRMWTDNDINSLEEEFRELAQSDEAACFIKYVDENPVAFAQCQLRHDYVEGTDSSPVGYLEGVFVSEEYRGKGYAFELLAACENWAREKGCTEFASDCELDNADSFRFHLATGFEEANRIICFKKRL